MQTIVICCEFRITIMRDVRVTVFDIAIPLNAKLQSYIEHDNILPLGMQRIAFLLKAKVLPIALTVWH